MFENEVNAWASMWIRETLERKEYRGGGLYVVVMSVTFVVEEDASCYFQILYRQTCSRVSDGESEREREGESSGRHVGMLSLTAH